MAKKAKEKDRPFSVEARGRAPSSLFSSEAPFLSLDVVDLFVWIKGG